MAARTVMTEGPQHIGVSSVMKQAGLTHGGFYVHVESRDSLIEAAIARAFEFVIKRWELEIADRSPEDAISAYIDFQLAPGRGKSLLRRCPIPAIAFDLPRLSMVAREIYAAGTDELVTSMARQLELLKLPDSEALARSVLSELAGAISLSRSEERRDIANRILESSRSALRRRLGLKPDYPIGSKRGSMVSVAAEAVWTHSENVTPVRNDVG